MNRDAITERFYTLVSPSHPNEWEVEEVVESLVDLPADQTRELLDHIPAIWPISHSLCFRYLRCGSESIGLLTGKHLPEWVRQILFHYEKGGLRDAELFMGDVAGNFLARQGSSSEVVLEKIRRSMQHYISGVASDGILLAEDQHVWTDTETIYLPPVLDLFSSVEENRLFYKFLITYQWVLIRSGVLFNQDHTGRGESEAVYWSTLAAQDGGDLLLRLYLFSKGCEYIRRNFPGLWRRSVPLLPQSFFGVWKQDQDCDLHQEEYLDFSREYNGNQNDWGRREELLLGQLNFSRADIVIRSRVAREKQAFVKMLARALPADLPETIPENENGDGPMQEAEDGIALLKEALEKAVTEKGKNILQIDNYKAVVPDELLRLAEKFLTELGDIPTGYIQAAAGLAGQGMLAGDGGADKGVPGTTAEEYVYDEWDCRRNGYRRDWCTVIEEELPVTRTNFIPRTLDKYSGLRKRLRTQFEMMATAHRFVRRQRDGADLDLDAIIDAMGDRAAGASVDENLFIRLLRDERSITTLFLIDMSNSTSGWIGTFIKESLVLLCEAMEKVGDGYGIYGFSGMRRSRCKIYPVKEIHQPYDRATMERISSIGPRDYTRMAPAIRHMTTLLEKAETKTRLLITLSDGKPEDYDGYNGEYAIEDTKKALLEARGKGVSPFCITIDKKAHDYLEHMFGAGNYTFINKIESLPVRMPQVYRMLTR